MTSLHEKALRATVERYNREANNFAKLSERDSLLELNLVEDFNRYVLEMPGERKVLDLGCGPGVRIPIFEAAGIGGYTGIDFSPGMIAKAQELFPGHQFVLGDIRNLDSFIAGKYDGWFAINLLVNVPLGMLRQFVPKLRVVLNHGAIGHLSTLFSLKMSVTKTRDNSIRVGWAPGPLVDAFTRDGLFELVGHMALDPSQEQTGLSATFRAI